MMLVRHFGAVSIGAAVVFAWQSSASGAQLPAPIGQPDATPHVTGLVIAQQTRPPAKAAQPAAPPAAAAPAAPAAPTGPVRTETQTFDTWTVTCREVVGSKGKKACAATLALARVENNQRQVFGAWVIGRNNEGVLTTVLQTPIFRTQTASAGVLISKGVELKLGNGAVRKLDYVACEPQRCDSSLPMDDAMVKEAVSAPGATITLYNKSGASLTINVPSIKGIDKALAAIPK
jgi:invasion protein IalB